MGILIFGGGWCIVVVGSHTPSLPFFLTDLIDRLTCDQVRSSITSLNETYINGRINLRTQETKPTTNLRNNKRTKWTKKRVIKVSRMTRMYFLNDRLCEGLSLEKVGKVQWFFLFEPTNIFTSALSALIIIAVFTVL